MNTHKFYFMKKIYSLLIFIIFINYYCFSQNGKLLLIGGGSEKETNNSWNSKAYKWAIDKSANKKVAIIAFGTSTSWLPDYFVAKCGAASAVNFDISTNEIANSQSTYDALMTYDVLFLKGGDQYNYYNIYKNTKTHQALADKFNSGGVICGTSAGLAILSEIVYTAQNSSAYPDECLKNPMNSDITLANDFLGYFPDYVFDTHFTIRARFPRLLAFMANWKFTKNENIRGLGVDEMTAMAIDENKVGTVFGIGSVNIYKAFSNTTFSQNKTKLIADSVNIIQLLQGCTYNFNTSEITGFSQKTTPEIIKEDGNYTILASGSNNLSENTAFLNDFATICGNISDQILIVTGSNQNVANEFKLALNNLGANNVAIFSALSINSNNETFKNTISQAKKILFLENNYTDLFNFISSGTVGEALSKKIQENIITAFVGDNSRFIGHTVVENYLTIDAAYKGNIILKEGFKLLKTTAIIPNMFLNADYYENTASSLPYSMIYNKLTYGIWLNKNNYFKYKANSENKPFLYAYGNSPVMILKNKGTNSGFSQQTAYGDDTNKNPNFAGFESMTLSLIDESIPYQLGEMVDLSSISTPEKSKSFFTISYFNNQIAIQTIKEKYQFSLYNLSGKIILSKALSGDESFPVNIAKGLYLAKFNVEKEQRIECKKIIIP